MAVRLASRPCIVGKKDHFHCPRNTRKDAKGDERCGWEAHVTSRDPTLDAVGTRSCAIRRGMSKKPATAILDLSLCLTEMASRRATPDRAGARPLSIRNVL